MRQRSVVQDPLDLLSTGELASGVSVKVDPEEEEVIVNWSVEF